MINFKRVQLSDMEWYDNVVKNDIGFSAFYNFGNLFVWDAAYEEDIALIQNRAVAKFFYKDNLAFSFPIGSGDLAPVILELKEYSESQGFPLLFYSIEENHAEFLKSIFPGKFEYEPLPSAYEYIYLAEKLSTYSGKSLHSKKNHCNNFEKAHPNWEFIPITKDNINECREMYQCWIKDNAERLDISIKNEHLAINRAFDNYFDLKLEGGILVHDTTIYGFSIGEMNNSRCFDVHFEKAVSDINGAYPMVCREMTKLALKNNPGLKYINREEDMGLESLRKSKESYKPEYLLKKYLVTWKYD